jgi:hypothetical protein
MQPDPEPRQTARARHGIGGGGCAHHQAGAGQEAVAACLLDRFVDRVIESEIVGADDETPPQCASSLSRRNWKNSTPSRSRRTIISGLRTISPTIEAILPARK